MNLQDFIGIFLEIYNAATAFIIIILIGQILFMMHKVDNDMLKAKLFLNGTVDAAHMDVYLDSRCIVCP